MEKIETFKFDDEVTVTTWDWEKGDMCFTARVVRETSPLHLCIRVDDGLTFVVPKADCELLSISVSQSAAA